MFKRLWFISSILICTSAIMLGQIDTFQPIELDFELVSVYRCNDYNDFYIDKYGNGYSNMIGIVKLINKTDSTFSFWIMNCSWTDLIKTAPDSIILEVKEGICMV